jgi:thymidylate kinase
MGIVPPSDLVPHAALARCLRELPNCVVLRNEEDLFRNLQRGGDVDLLVREPELAERILIRRLGPPVRITKRSYVTEYFYEWGNVDLLPSIEWQGARYLRTEAVVDGRRVSESGRPVPRIAHEALISWLTSLLWGGFFKERYASVIRQAVEVDGVAFRQALIEVAGKKWGVRLWRAAADDHPETSAAWVRSLRLVIWWRACFKSPVRTIERYLAFVTAELRLRLEPPVPWIAILGSDGSGKSSVVKEIVHRSTTCRYASVRAFHWRPRLIAKARGGEPVTDPHGKGCRGPIGSVLSLLVLATDWMVGYWTRLVHLRAKGYILAFDRMYFDLVVDPKRYRYGAGPRLARLWWWLLPKPDLVFFLDSAPDVLWRRKQEVPPPELARQRQAYTALVRQLPGGKVLNGSLPLSVLVDEIQQVIRAWMQDRSVASLSCVQASIMTAPIGSDEGPRGAPMVSRGDGSIESGVS